MSMRAPRRRRHDWAPAEPALAPERVETPRPNVPPELAPAIGPASPPLLSTGGAAVFHELRAHLRPGAFQERDGHPWPVAPINAPTAKGQIELKPPMLDSFPAIPAEELAALAAEMVKQASELSPLEADMLDALCHEWIMQARTPDARAVVGIDKLLKHRGIKPKKGGNGRRGGYEPEQRREIINALARLQSIWLDFAELDTYVNNGGKSKKTRKTRRAIKSRAFIFTTFIGQQRLDGSLDVDTVTFSLGELLALFLWGQEGRQTALLSAKALHYDPYREGPEKALCRYLSWQWKVRVNGGTYLCPYRVATLLENAGLPLNERKPTRTLARLEKALDTLRRDGVITSWRYESWAIGDTPAHGWAPLWLQALVIIEPPDAITTHYIEHIRGAALVEVAGASLPERLRATRARLGLSQAAAAEACDMPQQTYSRAERGAGVTPENAAKLEAWLAQHAPAASE